VILSRSQRGETRALKWGSKSTRLGLGLFIGYLLFAGLEIGLGVFVRRILPLGAVKVDQA